MGLYKSLAGMVTVELTSAGLGESLDKINTLGIHIFNVIPVGDLTLRFSIYRRDYNLLCSHAEKRGERLKLLGRQGLYWNVRNLFRRPVLLAGLCILTFLVLYVPSRVFWIEVEGNERIPDRLILQAAEESGICFGASRREVRSEKMKNALLGAVPELQWAGVNTYGCRAVISVRERNDKEDIDEPNQVSSIVAVRDGLVLSAIVTKGNGLCTPGQAVQEGDVLISGFTDCGLSIRATQAEGEVFAQTQHEIKAAVLNYQLTRAEKQQETKKYALIIGKKRINFYKGSGISGGSCVKMYSEYVLTLPGGFELPVALVKETFIEYDEAVSLRPEEEVAEEFTAFAEQYLKSQMIAGTILHRAESVTLEQECYTLTGLYACTEMIGRVRPEEIGEYHGKTD